MSEIENLLKKNLRHLITEDKVYQLSVHLVQSSDRGFDRDLVDFQVEGTNLTNSSDNWRTLLGMSEELYADYNKAA